MLKHGNDMCIPRSQNQAGFSDDERQLKLSVPETDKAGDFNSNRGECQFHLKAAVEEPANGGGDFIGVVNMTENAIDDGEPSRQPDSVNGNQLHHRLFAWLVARGKQMDGDGDQGHCKLAINIEHSSKQAFEPRSVRSTRREYPPCF